MWCWPGFKGGADHHAQVGYSKAQVGSTAVLEPQQSDTEQRPSTAQRKHSRGSREKIPLPQSTATLNTPPRFHVMFNPSPPLRSTPTQYRQYLNAEAVNSVRIKDYSLEISLSQYSVERESITHSSSTRFTASSWVPSLIAPLLSHSV